MNVSENIIYRCIAGEHILVPVGQVAASNNGLIVLNEVSADVWQLLSQGKTLDEIVDTVSQNYEEEAEVIRADVQELIQKLIALGLVEE